MLAADSRAGKHRVGTLTRPRVRDTRAQKTFSVPSYNTIGDPYLKDPKLRRPRGLGKGISGRYVGYSDNVLGTIGNTIHDTAPPNRSKADSYPLARGKQVPAPNPTSVCAGEL